nr:MAG TPA: hypothetical protein [Caudoviricetes sp.]
MVTPIIRGTSTRLATSTTTTLIGPMRWRRL